MITEIKQLIRHGETLRNESRKLGSRVVGFILAEIH